MEILIIDIIVIVCTISVLLTLYTTYNISDIFIHFSCYFLGAVLLHGIIMLQGYDLSYAFITKLEPEKIRYVMIIVKKIADVAIIIEKYHGFSKVRFFILTIITVIAPGPDRLGMASGTSA